VSRGVEIETEAPGTGDVAARGKKVVLRIKGSLRRGDLFMESERESFRIGDREVIAGLEYGVEGMRVGGRRRIRVPPHLGYREAGVPGKIPSDALLFFDLELLDVQD
jgi:FKBP-type peptidyl-prolyl cis-trans isomerase